MNKLSKIKRLSLLGALFVFLVAASFFIIFSQDKVSVAASTPTVRIQYGDDDGDSSPELPQDCGSQTGAWGSSTTDAQDPDCLRVQIVDAAGTTFTNDFRVCLRYRGVVQACTQYASQIGVSGQSITSLTPGGNEGNLSGTMEVIVQPNSSPGSVTYRNVSVGVGVGYQEDNNACAGGSAGMAWAAQGSTSAWAYSYRDDDPGCFQVGLSTSAIPAYRAQFVSSTLPTGTVASATSHSGNIIMKNVGNVAGQWDSDAIVSSTTTCGSPSPAGQTCQDNLVLKSNTYKLYRTDTSAVTAPSSLEYRRNVTINYRSVKSRVCVDTGGPGGPGGSLSNPNWLAQSLQFFVPKIAEAACYQWEESWDWVLTSQSPSSINVLTNENATFSNVNITTPTLPGTYHLKYKMGTSPSNLFDDEVDIPITIAGGLVPTVTTTPMTAITQTTASSGGNITSNGGSPVTRSGIIWGTTADLEYCDPTPTARCGDQTNGTTAMGPWTNAITGLTPGTTYYVRAYAINSVGIGYGAPQSGRTLSAGPTGTLDATNCEIQANQSTCSDTNVTWTTAGLIPFARTAVTHNNPDTTTVSTATSGTNVDSTVNYGDTTFYLYHDDAILSQNGVPAQKTITATCAAGTTWQSGILEGDRDGGKQNDQGEESSEGKAGGSKDVDLDLDIGGRGGVTSGSCVPVVGMYGTLTATPTSCIIPTGRSSCNVTLNWNTIQPEATSAVTSSYPEHNTTIATGNSGSQLVAIPYQSSPRHFYLYNNGKSLVPTSEAPNGSGITVTSRCALGNIWNGTECVSGTILIEPSGGGGTPAAGACSSPQVHYTCSNPPGNTGTNRLSSPSLWTWTCPGTGTPPGASVQCSERKSPEFIEN